MGKQIYKYKVGQYVQVKDSDNNCYAILGTIKRRAQLLTMESAPDFEKVYFVGDKWAGGEIDVTEHEIEQGYLDPITDTEEI